MHRDRRILEQRSAEGNVVAYFGYGSLVNTSTHQNETLHVQATRITGWRRAWRPRPDMPGFPAALLTVRPESQHACDGLLVFDHLDNLSAVDRREARYERHTVTEEMFGDDVAAPAGCPIYVYSAHENVPVHPRPPQILRSYLDAVLQGFLTHFGEDGVFRFVRETDNWEIGVVDDRSAPIYPRSVRLSRDETAFFDGVLDDAGIRHSPVG